jgi:hypothetical protein
LIALIIDAHRSARRDLASTQGKLPLPLNQEKIQHNILYIKTSLLQIHPGTKRSSSFTAKSHDKTWMRTLALKARIKHSIKSAQ